MDDLKLMMGYTFLGIEVTHILLAVACLLGGYVLRGIVMSLLKRAVHLTSKTETAVDDIVLGSLTKPLSAMCFILGLWAAYEVLPISHSLADVDRFIRAVLKATTVWIAIWFVLRLIDRSTHHMQDKAEANKTPIIEFVPLLRRTSKIILVLIGIVIIFQELGYSVTSLIAGLGLGGLALGLAAKDTLANFFGSVVIFVDRPFVRGDWVKIGEHEGIVEDISIRVTRLRTWDDALVTIPNSQLTTTAIINNAAMRRRRIKLKIELTYTTAPEKIEAATNVIKEMILADVRLHNQPVIVVFNEIASYSLNIMIICFTITTINLEFLAIQQDLLLSILRRLTEMGIEFAYPTQTVEYVGKNTGRAPLQINEGGEN